MLPPSTPASLEAPAKPDATIEITFWNSIKDSNNPGAFRSYLEQYPSGAFAAIARLRLQELDQPTANAEPAAASGVFPLSSTQALTAQQLSALDCDRLWIARNEIFARKGYCFQSARGIGYFGNANCSSSSQDILTPLEQGNVALIKSWETQKTCR
jgi:hypothetical protein